MPGTQTQSGVTKSPYEPGVYFVRGQTWQVKIFGAFVVVVTSSAINGVTFLGWRKVRVVETARLGLVLRSVPG